VPLSRPMYRAKDGPETRQPQGSPAAA